MEQRLLLATSNKGKVKELQDLLDGTGITVLDLSSFPGVRLEETGDTFEANAIQKAQIAARSTGLWCLADDSGLEVEALGGAPGVHTARFAGPDATDEQNNRLLLQKMRAVPEDGRRARFVSAVALCSPDGECVVKRGVCEGRIASELRGTGGFGYDPLFYLPEFGKTYSELSLAEKNSISHRGKAFRGVLGDILARLGVE